MVLIPKVETMLVIKDIEEMIVSPLVLKIPLSPVAMSNNLVRISGWVFGPNLFTKEAIVSKAFSSSGDSCSNLEEANNVKLSNTSVSIASSDNSNETEETNSSIGNKVKIPLNNSERTDFNSPCSVVGTALNRPKMDETNPAKKFLISNWSDFLDLGSNNTVATFNFKEEMLEFSEAKAPEMNLIKLIFKEVNSAAPNDNRVEFNKDQGFQLLSSGEVLQQRRNKLNEGSCLRVATLGHSLRVLQPNQIQNNMDGGRSTQGSSQSGEQFDSSVSWNMAESRGETGQQEFNLFFFAFLRRVNQRRNDLNNGFLNNMNRELVVLSDESFNKSTKISLVKGNDCKVKAESKDKESLSVNEPTMALANVDWYSYFKESKMAMERSAANSANCSKSELKALIKNWTAKMFFSLKETKLTISFSKSKKSTSLASQFNLHDSLV
ncbi:hypothetical protein WICPIJ_007886 [Wickerhamomyces pijperi]|uniref:Uncharacterized protein n=1 Tax=Wickerhamomyces pijperi TaxID=599730 RepID=A0A9P8PZH1_WICPI|nr:hypothetical protein WICPIJ_007886 [Wickerhamomyces pijperi]